MIDRAQLDAAIAAWQGPLLRFARRLTSDGERAADAVQDAFLCLCRHRDPPRGEHLGAWLFTTCRHRIIDRHRKERPMQALPDTEPPGPEADPAARITAGETHSALNGALAVLSPRQREIVAMKFQDGLRYREIAAALDLSVGTVGAVLHEAMARLRDALGRCDLQEGGQS